MASGDIESVCRFFTSRDITISPTNKWLTSCVEWFKTENVGCNIQQIQEFAYCQLLLADLYTISQKCLPPYVSEARSSTLQGKYFLQINYVIDVGKSAYSQFQSLRKHSLANLEVTEEKQEFWTPQPNRMLKLEMTDGISIVYGMEYSSISKLNTNIMPGTKVVVKGPVECRSSVLFLQDKNIVLLGGEVDSLYDSNHYNRVITRTLRVDENLLPIDDDETVTLPPISAQPQDQNSCNTLPTLTQLSSDGRNSAGLNLESTHTSRTNNLDGGACNKHFQSSNDDYFADDNDIFLSVPVDNVIDNTESSSVKKKLIEVNASVTAFKSKLIIKDNNWHVVVRINTEDGSMKACFDPDLLDRLIGFSPEELNSKEREIAVNPAVKEKINGMLKRGQQVIKDLKCHMTLIYEQGSELPVIIAISDDKAFYDPTKVS